MIVWLIIISLIVVFLLINEIIDSEDYFKNINDL